jgi:flagellar biosynthesis/type III secretory pathway chaperone
MARPSASEARTRIVEVVGESVYHALGLKESLEVERSALEAQDTDALHDAVSVKGKCVDLLRQLEEKRAALCESFGFKANARQMEQLSDWCDENSEIANCWSHLISIAAECNALNLTNGAIIRIRQQHMDSNLAVLRGADHNPDTYARHGAEHAGLAQRSLAQV